jgi:hypothetical protein
MFIEVSPPPRHPVLAHMRVDLRGRQVHMPQEHLDIHELGAGLQESSCVGMAELMGGDLLIDACPGNGATQVRPHHMGGQEPCPPASWQIRTWFRLQVPVSIAFPLFFWSGLFMYVCGLRL